MNTKSLPLLTALGIFCNFPTPSFCDTPAHRLISQVAAPFHTIAPLMDGHGTSKDLDRVVLSFQRQGFVISDRQQKLDKAGKLVYSHFRLALPPGKLTHDSSLVSGEVTWTPRSLVADFRSKAGDDKAQASYTYPAPPAD